MPFRSILKQWRKSSKKEKFTVAQNTSSNLVSQNENSSNGTTIPNDTSKSVSSSNTSSASMKRSKNDKHSEQNKFIFHCQLAHGSPTGLITGFSNVKELYEKIAECFEIPPSTVLFCTLNTHKIDMSKLLSGQMGLDDFIFVHVKGQAKEMEILKSDESLGLTITDNGAGFAFIKRIKEGSTIDRLHNLIKVGDHIEKINDKSMVGARHFEVAKILKEIPVGTTFTIRLVEPNSFGFHIEAPKRIRKGADIKSGTKTLRFQSNGAATIEDVDDAMIKGIERINHLLESYMGIDDSDLAHKIWDLAQNKNNPSDFALAVDESEIGAFNFTDEFIFDLWAAVGDVKAGYIGEPKEIENERL